MQWEELLAAELALVLAAKEHKLHKLCDLNLNKIVFTSLDDSGSASGLDFPLVSRAKIRSMLFSVIWDNRQVLSI